MATGGEEPALSDEQMVTLLQFQVQPTGRVDLHRGSHVCVVCDSRWQLGARDARIGSI